MTNTFYKSIIILILCISHCICGKGQTIDETFTLAESQFVHGNFANAEDLAWRVIYFDTKYEYTPACELLLAKIYFSKGDVTQAANYFEKVFSNTTNDSIRTEVLFDKGMCYLLQRQYNYALNELLTIKDNDTAISKRKNLYLGVTYYYMQQYDESKKYLLQLAKHHEGIDTNDIEALLLAQQKITKRYNPKTARILSLILPGAGQVYSGDIKNGLNSLLLVIGFGYLGYTVVVNGTTIDALVAVLPWLQRYYYGGSQKAEQICRDKLQFERNQLMHHFLMTLGPKL